MQQDAGIQLQDLAPRVLRSADVRRSTDPGGWLRTLAIAVCLVAGAVLLIAVTGPKHVSSAALGSEWQCSKAAFVTTCRPLS
ncbi:hypothetical protein [Bradyrhizobium ivorense]|uniref:hypothetical protein n=1 Tax=Bradyrhizobium ivorense TaxID=2511166 RepID=UPI0010B1F5C2|nr:hypothetical protein [Bradyrhizobium ivorense]VIO74358.1 hypothetical protein CI41S_43830 [Bradyrhizobium ivorense]